MRRLVLSTCLALLPLLAHANEDGRRWLAGDHHVHSEWSVDWDESVSPPRPIRGGDSPYTRTDNARAASLHGLRWMVHTDHGGPGHSAVTREGAWPALQAAREAVPELIQFHGMEFDVPAGEHASLIIAPGPDEAMQQYEIERDFNRREPLDKAARDTDADMRKALAHMRALQPRPLMFINHPSRTATAPGSWGEVTPQELRHWQDAAPDVLVGMEGAPGHQADRKTRGLYRNAAAPSDGGFDQMTTQIGGVWDQLLAEGRRFWITANSDAHRHAGIGGSDFYPGEYSKTYVWARPQAADVLDGLRHGRMFVVTGDLIDGLDMRLQSGRASAGSGQTLSARDGDTLVLTLRISLPAAPNFHNARPILHHIDIISGQPGAGTGTPTMQVQTLTAAQWKQEGRTLSMTVSVPRPSQRGFVRVRGTSTAQAHPAQDVPGEDPWEDLWFYSNPIFIEAAG
ncbi:hypothetical protein [Pseudoxanthomonas composti]|uniref:Phosphoesterase n=1 Tax=Pseudoxanthomonas composti TaxID=2137479 RepID=A0A4Q1JS36_9GAMM|nr:hypothetical protein [Pseudoxanthomonas composti]RXR02032.1 hypothetical protein EPA99_15360 [Pseudoxanthomonas composti]